MSALTCLAALFSAIILYATYLGTDEAKWSVYVAAGMCLCIAGWQASSFIIGMKLRHRLKGSRQSSISTAEVEGKQTQLLSPADMNPYLGQVSVTENATQLLDPEYVVNRRNPRNLTEGKHEP